MKTIKIINKKITLFQIVKQYIFQSKAYPVLLYNLYGSEGNSQDRHIVDEMIKQHGFWKTVFKLIRFSPDYVDVSYHTGYYRYVLCAQFKIDGVPCVTQQGERQLIFFTETDLTYNKNVIPVKKI